MFALSAADRSSSLEALREQRRALIEEPHSPTYPHAIEAHHFQIGFVRVYWQTQLHSSHNPRESWYRYARSLQSPLAQRTTTH
jgi:hypothetical protein